MAGIFDDDESGTPGLSILGMLLGGRGYAAQHFAMRDQAAIDEKRRGDREAFATGLLGSDELARANASPLDRNAQFGLWGKFYGEKGGDVNLGNSLLDNSIKAIYGREADVFKDELWRKQLNLSAESELKVDQIKRERDVQGKKDALKFLFAPGESGQPGIVEQAMRNQAFDAAGLKRPEGYDVVPGNNGLAFRPAPGTDDYRKMFGEVQANQNILSGLKNLSDMANFGTGSSGNWDAERTALLLEVKKAESLGALDQGTVDFFDKMIPGYWADWSPGSGKWGATSEKLRVQLERAKGKLNQTLDRWQIPANMVQDRNTLQAPSTPTKPMPSGPATIPTSPPRDLTTRYRWDRLKPQPEEPPPQVRGYGSRGGNTGMFKQK
jgi:hypothetical protein